MTTTLPLAEIQHDLEATDLDILRLNAILDNLHLFINDSDGEDRSFLKLTVRTFENLISQAMRLRAKIITAQETALAITSDSK